MPSWDDTAMGVVKLYAERSHCKYYQVGAAFYKGDQLLAVGYNGPTRGDDHCDEVGCAKEIDGVKQPSGSGECRGAHAEMNAVTNAAGIGTPGLKGSRIYCTYSPCSDCAKHLRNLGITEFIYELEYDGSDVAKAFELFAKAGIAMRQYKKGEKL